MVTVHTQQEPPRRRTRPLLYELASGAIVGTVLYLSLFGTPLCAKILRHLTRSVLPRGTTAVAPHADLASAVSGRLSLLFRTRFLGLYFVLLARLALLAAVVGALLGLASAVLVRLRRGAQQPGTSRLLVAEQAAVVLLLGLFAWSREWLLRPSVLDTPGTSMAWRQAIVAAARHGGAPALWGALLAAASLYLLPAARRAFRAARALRQRAVPRRALATMGGVTCALVILLLVRIPSTRSAQPAAAPNAGPNVLILAADSVRADHLGLYGYRRDTSPNIDRYFARGVVFDDAEVPLARTLPSWATLLTGAYPQHTGFRNMYPLATRLPPGVGSLPEILRRHGYRTAVLSDWAGAFFRRVDLGFERVETPEESIREFLMDDLADYASLLPFLDTGLGRALVPDFEGGRPSADAARLAAHARELLLDLARSPRFFLVVFTTAPHHPYQPAYPYYTRYTDPGYDGPNQFERDVGETNLDRAFEREPEADQRQIVDLYDGTIAEWDASLAPVFATLDETGLSSNTIVVLLSDHGEFLYENGTWPTHGDWLDRGAGANRIPLAIRLPGTSEAGHHLPGLVPSVDLAPTLLDLLGLPAPPSADGRSLAGSIRGTCPLPPGLLFGETGLWFLPQADLQPGDRSYPTIDQILEVPDGRETLVVNPDWLPVTIAAKQRMIETSDWKLVYRPRSGGGGRYELFSRRSDRDDRHDLSRDRPEIGATLRALLDPTLRADGITPGP